MEPAAWVYMLASRPYGTLYVGVTNDLVRRVYEHKHALVPGFTSRYGVTFLVWYEPHDEFAAAIQRGKLIKRWKRRWKLELVEQINPDWRDLYPELNG